VSDKDTAWLRVEQAADDLENHAGDSIKRRARMARAIHAYTASENEGLREALRPFAGQYKPDWSYDSSDVVILGNERGVPLGEVTWGDLREAARALEAAD